MVWVELLCPLEQCFSCFSSLRIWQAALDRALYLTHRALVKAHAFGTALWIYHPNGILDVFADGAYWARLVACAAIDAIFGDIKAHAGDYRQFPSFSQWIAAAYDNFKPPL